MGELYGEFSELTQEWHDGLASTIMRRAVADEGEHRRYKQGAPVSSFFLSCTPRVILYCNSSRADLQKTCSQEESSFQSFHGTLGLRGLRKTPRPLDGSFQQKEKNYPDMWSSKQDLARVDASRASQLRKTFAAGIWSFHDVRRQMPQRGIRKVEKLELRDTAGLRRSFCISSS